MSAASIHDWARTVALQVVQVVRTYKLQTRSESWRARAGSNPAFTRVVGYNSSSKMLTVALCFYLLLGVNSTATNVTSTTSTTTNPGSSTPTSGVNATSTTASPGSSKSTTTKLPYSIKPGGNRIVNGVKADITPFILSLVINGIHACGAALLNKDWALSAAHCCGFSVYVMKLRAGSSARLTGGTLYDVAQTIKHYLYNKTTTTADICLIRSKRPIIFTYYVQPIALCTAEQYVVDGDPCVVIGWGRTTEGGTASDTLLMANIEVIDLNYCRDVYGANLIDERQFCAGDTLTWKTDTCQGDSGGPVVAFGCLMGVVSWGIGCARLGNPGVYTLVPAYCAWIASNTGILSCLSQRTRMSLAAHNSSLVRPVQISIN